MMTWTTTLPTGPGFYWARHPELTRPMIVRVELSRGLTGDRRAVSWFGNEEEERISESGITAWAGPLEPPA